MIKQLKKISEIIHNWLPLNYVRKAIDKRLILEYFQDDKNTTGDILFIFGIKDYISELSEDDLNKLINILESKIDVFIMINLKILGISENREKNLEEEAKQQLEMKLEDIWLFMKQIVADVQDWVKRPMCWYLELKRIEKGVSNYLDMLKDLAFEDFDNYDNWVLPYWFIWNITNKISINFTQDEVYSERYDKLKEREKLLKLAVDSDKKWVSINDEDWCVIKVPDFKFSSYLTVKKWK